MVLSAGYLSVTQVTHFKDFPAWAFAGVTAEASLAPAAGVPANGEPVAANSTTKATTSAAPTPASLQARAKDPTPATVTNSDRSVTQR